MANVLPWLGFAVALLLNHLGDGKQLEPLEPLDITSKPSGRWQTFLLAALLTSGASKPSGRWQTLGFFWNRHRAF